MAGQRGWNRVALYGASELAEIACLCDAPEVEVVILIDPTNSHDSFAHLPMVGSIEAAGEIDALLLTTRLSDPQATYDALIESFPAARVLVPNLLRVREARDKNEGAES